MNMEERDRLIAYLQSIAIQAVRAQEHIDDPEAVMDHLCDVQCDLEKATIINNSRF